MNEQYPADAPRIVTTGHMDFTEARQKITGGPWLLRQTWLDAEQPGLRTASVHFAWEPNAFWVLARLTDDEITTASTADNQDLWALGDVFEVFIGRDGIPDYLELHTSPSGHRLHLAFPSDWREIAQSGTARLDDFRQSPIKFSSLVNKLREENAWEVLTKIPAQILPPSNPLTAGQILNVSFCRYDAGSNGDDAILSSTSPHAQADYHRRHEWRNIQLADA